MSTLQERLRAMQLPGAESATTVLMAEAADRIDADAERIRALEAENANLRTVMVAAAEEIHRHWDAHCDAEGYGPANLMRRLEEGIAAQYGYTAGAFEEQRERIAALEAALRFYASGDHFNHNDEDWDTVSGEPQNFWCDEAGTATVEDGTVARMALAGSPLEDERIAALEAENAALRADAERWRHWRKHHHSSALQSFGYTESQVEHWTNERNEQLLDAAIDAARSKT